ncbi:MAG: hypothetical protein ACNA8W_23030, partial [Bradymonadaceae bacterium]
ITTGSGVQAVLDAIEPAETDADPQTFDPPIEVTNATVIATSWTSGNFDQAQVRFWVQDADAAIQFFLPEPLVPNIQVGQHVSFTATSGNVFLGHPQINGVEDFVVNESGQPVPYKEITTQDITVADYNHTVRVTGALSVDNWDCGGNNKCWDLTYGDGKEVIVRSSTPWHIDGSINGSCATFVGPVLGFPGPKDAQGGATTPQLEVINGAWLHIPQSFDD